MRASAVKQAALARGLPVIQVEDFKSPQAMEVLQSLRADAMVVVAYGLLLPQAVLDLFGAACWNLHASLLPRWRGAAPIARAIEAGDLQTGVAVMKMERGLDTGGVLMQIEETITPEDSTQSLQARLALLGAGLMVEAIDRVERLLQAGQPIEAVLEPQSSSGIVYAAKLRKDEARLDFTQPAQQLERKMRAFDPTPGCLTWYLPPSPDAAPQMLKCWRGRVQPMPVGQTTDQACKERGQTYEERSQRGAFVQPGLVIGFGADGPLIACGADCLELREVQAAGGLRQPASRWASQVQLRLGDRLGDPGIADRVGA
ncbi:MAG: methionyl-tRNA formyltransferase [Betaproteobacteria bacterium]|nr:methionyl-tRNA formyltransferase [Betaproteobacteria bacterium]NCV59868.1 methionyl-tRNA formyltransferase [Betaproteobacteria bacterium]